MLEKLFKLKAHGTDLRTEVIAGITTFLTMAYIIFVNPSMLAATGMDQGAVFVATCLAAAIGCFIMGLYANYPIAQAPGMGLNAFFTYGVVLGMGHTWQVALGAVFLSGCIFTCLSLFKVREWIINSIPQTLRVGIAAGIGLFLGFIALQNAGIVVDNSATLISLGHQNPHQMILAALGFFLIIGLEYRKVKGGVLISILAITALSIVLGYSQYHGVMSMPPNPAPTFLQLDIAGAFDISMLSVIFAFLFVDLFDTAGTLTAVAQRGNLLDEHGHLPNLKKALLADSTATVTGSLLGTSSTTSYVESGAGVEVGGRTGLTAVVVGILFVLALLFSPLAGMIPAYATAGALFYVCILMLSGLVNVDWTDLTEAAPAAIVAILMPLSFSIADGIAVGFISYAVIKLLAGRHKEVPLSVWVLALVFLLKFAFF
ncbi:MULTISPECIES: NCS2 family permease [unclassified Agarivorans]|uniref:NCS2 family permease n=1 Tax=unclassified Agarivorans TaxID=2636026 RepID=UPI003D7EAD87